jgi:hypothetical protein
MTAAAKKVEFTRARLRHAMEPPVEPRRGSGQDGDTRDNPRWLRKLKGLPAIGVVVDALDSWWKHHPLRPVSHVVGQASSAAVKPLAQSNPISLVAGAAVAGAVLVWTRPWRWLIRPALFAGLIPQIASRVVARMPLEAWMAGLDSVPTRR